MTMRISLFIKRIAIVVVLVAALFAGVSHLRADTVSWPVSVAIPTGMVGELGSKPVSVGIPTGMLGDMSSRPVSVALPVTVADGTYAARPASVSVQPEKSDPDLVGLWHMDGDWGDSSGNGLHGAPVNGPIFGEKKFGSSSGSFDGGDDHIRVGNLYGKFPANAFTIETWVKLDSTGNGARRTFAGGTGVAKDYTVGLNGNQFIALVANGSQLFYANSGVTPNLGEWYHVVSTFDGSYLTIYVNGQLKGQTPATWVQANGGADFWIGGEYCCSSRVDGLIDEVALYRRALTPEEVAFHYSAGVADPNAPAAPAINPPPAFVGTQMVTVTGTKPAETAIWVNGKKVVNTDAATTWQGSYGPLQPGHNLLEVVAVDAAFRRSLPATARLFYDTIPPVIESTQPANGSDTAKPVSTVTITLVDAHAGINLIESTQGATVKNAAGQLVNGSWSVSGSKSITYTPAEPLPADTYTVMVQPVDMVGNKGNYQIVFTNHDVSMPVTKAVLSGTKGSDGWYSTPVSVTLNASDGDNGAGIEKIEYTLEGTTWETYAVPFVVEKDGVTDLQFRATDKEGNVEAPAKTTQIKINKSGLVGWWKMDGDWKDASHLGNNGTPQNGVTFSANAKIGTNAVSFDGVDDGVEIAPSSSLRPSKVTVAAWVNPQATGVYKTIITNEPISSSTEVGFGFRQRTDDTFWFVLGREGQGASSPAISTTRVAANNWYHLTGTYDGSQIKLYVNGVLESTVNVSAPINSSAPLRFGRLNSNGEPFNGLLDDVRIYNRALSATEVMEQFRNITIGVPTVDPVTSPVNTPVITLSGTKPANTSVVISSGTTGAEIAPQTDAEAWAATTWQGQYTLKSGMNSLNITAKDADGFHSQATTISVALDDTAPQVTATTPADHGVSAVPVSSITFTLADAFSSLDLAATIQGATVKSGSNLDVAGTWSTTGSGATGSVTFMADQPMTEGTYTAAITPTDSFGNRGSATMQFTVDATPPAAPGIDPVTLPTNLTSKIVTGTKSTDSVKVVVTCPGASVGTVSYPSATTWSVTVSGLREGQATVTAVAEDAAANRSSAAGMSFMVDTTPPAKPTIEQPATPTNKTSVTVRGTKDTGSTVFVNNAKTSASVADGAWSHSVNLNEGSNTITVFARDEAGNQSQSASVTVVRDTVPPTIGASTPASNAMAASADSITVTLAGGPANVDLQASMAGAVVKSGAGAVVGGSWSAAGEALLFTPTTTLAEGSYTVTIYPVDVLGNKGSASFSFTIDNGPPTVQSLALSPASPVKAGTTTFTLVFSEAMDTGVQPSVAFGAQPVAVTGSWIDAKTWRGSSVLTAATGDGVHSVSVTGAKDKAGNAMADVVAGTFVLDTMPPESPMVGQVSSPTRTTTQTLSGAKPAETAIVINNTVRVPLNSATTWSYSYPLAEGNNALAIVARDAAGNDSPAAPAVAIVLDTTPPLFTVDTYTSPATTATQTIAGKKEPGCVVKLNGATILEAADQNGTWSHLLTLTEGITNHLVFTAADALGNTTTKVLDILFDAAPPVPLSAGMLTANGNGRGTDVILSWPSYAETVDLAYYRIFVSPANFSTAVGISPAGTVTKGTRTFKATGLTQGTTYYFAVVPVDGSGNSDPSVNTVSAVPTDTAPPEDVAGLAAVAGHSAADGNYVTLTWNASVNSAGDLAEHIVYVDAGTGYDAGTPVGKTAVTRTVKGLADNTLHKFKVTVKDTGGRESVGAVAQAGTRLPNPTGITATPGNQKAVISWNGVNSPYVKFYNIYRIKSDAPQPDAAAMTLVRSQTTTTFTDTGLTNGSSYQYAVTALNSWGAERMDVQSVGVTPRGDTVGPVIGTVSVTPNQVITKPLTITASAQDAESAMDRVELHIDGAKVASQNGSSVSYSWNVVSAADGNHTVKVIAYDAPGNATEQSVPIVVSLAPPATPTISTTFSGPVSGSTVTINGTATPDTTVSLRVNGTVVAQAAATATGTFAFSGVQLVEGDNLVAIKAAHRGGESPYSADLRVTVDSGAPAATTALAAKPLAGGSIQFSWQTGSGEVPTGYNLYESTGTFTSRTDAGVRKVNSTPIPYLLKEIIPADDASRFYAVTALDGAGNEGTISAVIAAASDRLSPSVSGITFTLPTGSSAPDNVYGPGTMTVTLTASETLAEIPFLSLEPPAGSPLVVGLRRLDDVRFEGTVTLDATSPHGSTNYKFSGKDRVGNRGTSQGAGATIDVRGPVVEVLSPMVQQKTSNGPFEVFLSFDEPTEWPPQFELRSGGVAAAMENLVSQDSGLHWRGQIDPSALPEGTGQFVLVSARDRFDNLGTTVKSGGQILLYKTSPPAPPAPTGLTATPAKGGVVTLAWEKVADALGYRLYRTGEGETVPALIHTAGNGSELAFSDPTPMDGTYSYTVSAVGILDVESSQSTPATATADRSAPPAPTGLSLAFSGNGVRATWNAPSTGDEQPASYRLYRNGGNILDLGGLAAVATVNSSPAVDAGPTSAKRFYAVTALDALGNESAPSPTVEITFPVAPVKNLVLSRVDDGKPALSWEAGESNLQGFHIYRNGSRITQVPTTATSYTDGYYAGGTVAYGISAVNSLGTESPAREAVLPPLTIALREGTVLRRGVLETVPLVATLPQDATGTVTVDAVTLKIGTLPESTLAGPFTVSAAAPVEVQKVAATEATAPPQEAVVATAVLTPTPGTTVKVTRSSLASILGSGTALEIFNDPLVRGTTGTVRIKVNNLGSARTEFVTSENNAPSTQVKVFLKDQDGNILAQGRLDQRVGSVVNSGAYATARLEPGQSFLSEPIAIAVPSNAPYRVVLEAVIDNTYYHYRQDDQVVAPGLKQTTESTIADVAYMASAQTDKTVYKQGEAVIISGHAISTSSGQAMPSVPVKIGVSVKGFDRFFTVNTDSAGAFSYNFTPAANETGSYSVWAAHPELFDRSIQARFSIIGLQIYPTLANVQLLKGQYKDVPLTITNLGGSPLTGLVFTPTASSGITANVVNPGADTLTAGEVRNVFFRIVASDNASASGYASIEVATAEGLKGKVDASVSIVNPLPILSTKPSFIDTGLVRSAQKIESCTIANNGYGTLQNARIEGPSIPWLSLTVDRKLGDIAVGQSKTVGILISPSETVAQGVYNDRIVIYSDNHIPYTYNIQVTVTTDAVGSVQFSVLNELMKDVSGATIAVQNQNLTELIYNLKTAADGTVALFDIPEGRYSFNVSAPNHKPLGGSFVIVPGVTTTVPVGLEYNMIQIEWSVTPTTIQDRYQITINQTFETNVPAPVLVTEPPTITIPDMAPGQVFNGEYTVTNYGLIAVDDININFPTTFGEYDIEILLSVMPKRLNAMQKITIPYRITRRQATASVTGNAVASIGDEVGGYGGGGCVTSFSIGMKGTATICPNTPQQRTVDRYTSYTVAVPVPCPTGSTGVYVSSSGSSTYNSGGVCTNCQSGSGGVPGGVPTPIKTDNPCDCVPEGTQCPGSAELCWKNVCKGGTCTRIPDDSQVPPQKGYGDCNKEICRGGAVVSVPDDNDGCDDGKMCTSYEAKPGEVGLDRCTDGKCEGKKIEDKAGTKVEAQLFDVETKFTAFGSKFMRPGCKPDEKMKMSGGFDGTPILRCCEDKKAFVPGYEYSGSVDFDFGTIKCETKPRMFLIGLVPVAYVKGVGTMNLKAAASVSGTTKPCDEECDWKVTGGATASFSHGLEAALITSSFGFDLLKITGTVNTSGSGELSVDCKGQVNTKGCLGKVEAAINVTTLGIYKIKPPALTLEDGFCW